MKNILYKIILAFFAIAGITPSSKAQTAQETLKWLNDNKVHLREGDGHRKYLYNFTDEAFEYLGEEFYGKLKSEGVVKFRWAEITNFFILHAHVTEVLVIKGKGVVITDDGIEEIENGSDFTLMGMGQAVRSSEFLDRLRYIALLKGAKLNPKH